MPTDLDLVNEGLNLVGENRIPSLTNTTNSKLIETAKFFLPRVKRAVLRAHDWNCARRRKELAAATNESLGEWGLAYRLPPECLAVRRFVSSIPEVAYAPFSVEIDSQNKPILYTDEGVNKIVFTGEISVDRWDSLLFDMAATRLAIEFASVFPRDVKFVEAMWRTYSIKLDETRGVSETEGGIERVYSDSIASVR
jgi:hypothetical protein